MAHIAQRVSIRLLRCKRDTSPVHQHVFFSCIATEARRWSQRIETKGATASPANEKPPALPPGVSTLEP
jgi:hypothetical protein